MDIDTETDEALARRLQEEEMQAALGPQPIPTVTTENGEVLPR